MLLITYSILLVYILPLIFIFGSYWVSEGFTLRDNMIYVADAVSGTFFSLFRDTFGSIVVPLITAYALPAREPDKPVSRQSLALFMTLVGFFLLTTALYGLVKYHEVNLRNFNVTDEEGKLLKDVPKIFFDTLLAYGKETLTYIALILGLSLKK